MSRPGLGRTCPASPGPATYGQLLSAAADSAAMAVTAGAEPFDDPRHVGDAVLDYVRFLGVAGRHLTMLLTTAGEAPHHPDSADNAHRTLATALSALAVTRAGTSAWSRSGDQLGAAHDLLATHLGPHGEHRSPDAARLADPRISQAAAQRVVDMTRAPVAAAPDVLAAALAVTPGGRIAASAPSGTHGAEARPHLTRQQIRRLRDKLSALAELHGRLPVVSAPEAAVLEALDALTPVRSRIAEYAGPSTAGPGMDALGLLRLLSHRQATGTERANAYTVHDLTSLAVTTLAAAEQLLPLATTPLGRVDRAAALDALNTATSRWKQADAAVYPRVQAVAKAPRLYHDAATNLTAVLTTGSPHGMTLTRAVLACLPRLATDASKALQHHKGGNGLVVARRDPGQLTRRWVPLPPSDAAQAAEALVAAGLATRAAGVAVTRHLERAGATPSATRAGVATPDVPHRQHRHGRDLAR